MAPEQPHAHPWQYQMAGTVGRTDWLVDLDVVLTRLAGMDAGTAAADAAAIRQAAQLASSAADHLRAEFERTAWSLRGHGAEAGAQRAIALAGELSSLGGDLTAAAGALDSAAGHLAATRAYEATVVAQRHQSALSRSPSEMAARLALASRLTATYSVPMGSAGADLPTPSVGDAAEFGGAVPVAGHPAGAVPGSDPRSSTGSPGVAGALTGPFASGRPAPGAAVPADGAPPPAAPASAPGPAAAVPTTSVAPGPAPSVSGPGGGPPSGPAGAPGRATPSGAEPRRPSDPPGRAGADRPLEFGPVGFGPVAPPMVTAAPPAVTPARPGVPVPMTPVGASGTPVSPAARTVGSAPVMPAGARPGARAGEDTEHRPAGFLQSTGHTETVIGGLPLVGPAVIGEAEEPVAAAEVSIEQITAGQLAAAAASEEAADQP